MTALQARESTTHAINTRPDEQVINITPPEQAINTTPNEKVINASQEREREPLIKRVGHRRKANSGTAESDTWGRW
jgi:hypothetical protein